MATVVLATAAGAAVVLYYTGFTDSIVLPWPLGGGGGGGGKTELMEIEEEDGESERERLQRIREQLRRPARPPTTWSEALSMLAEALRFAYSETLGKWPIHHLAFGINYLLRRQGQLHVAEVYAGEGSTRLSGSDVIEELEEAVKLISMCYLFSKKPFLTFLEETGFQSKDVLLYQSRAGLLKPAFTVVLDHDNERILVIIRGTHSMKDTLTVVTGAVVPFHHAVMDGSGVRQLVLGYAHCGMVAAARCIAQLAEPKLRECLEEYPHYRIKVIGHSLGGGTAALLTYALREKVGLGGTTCTAFAPAACMTWELAESGIGCVTSFVHGSDVVPTFSAASADDLRAEVLASAWVNDLREQLEQMQILRIVMGSAGALQQRLISIGAATNSSVRASLTLYNRIEMARLLQPSLTLRRATGALWQPVSRSSRVMMQQMKTMVPLRQSLTLPAWSCMGTERLSFSNSGPATLDEREEETGGATPTRRVSTMRMERGSPKGEGLVEDCREREREKPERVRKVGRITQEEREDAAGLAALLDAMHREPEEKGGRVDDDGDDCEIRGNKVRPGAEEEGYSWEELEAELSRNLERVTAPDEEEEAAAREITREEEEVASHVSSADRADHENEEVDLFLRDPRRFFPCGRILHLVRNSSTSPNDNEEKGSSDQIANVVDKGDWKIGLFSTDRALYGRVHLSRAMVTDHFMPNYKKAMQDVVTELQCEQGPNGSESDMDLDIG